MAAILDELLGCPPTEIPRAPQDSALHGMSREATATAYKSVSAVHRLRSVPTRWDGAVVIEPGDVLVCQVGKRGGAGHVMVVGRRAHAYHADSVAGVVRTALPTTVLHVWRSERRSEWQEVER